MTRKVQWAIGAIVSSTLAIASVLVLRFPNHQPPQLTNSTKGTTQVSASIPRPPASSVASAASAERALVPRAKPASIIEWHSSNLPRDQLIVQLQRLSEQGNVAAERSLTSHLSACTSRSLRADDASDELDRQGLEVDKQNQSLDEGLRKIRMKNTHYRLDRNAAIRTACAKLPTDLMTHWLDPLDRAAQAGDIIAMREYASLALADYDSVQSVVSDVDNAIVRRDKARTYLLKALEWGDKDSLAELANAYFNMPDPTPRLFEFDPFQAYSYAYAATLAGNLPARNGIDVIMSESAKSLDATQIINAQNQGRQIFELCCSSR